MNSRERRKVAAKTHNDRLIEEEGYVGDKQARAGEQGMKKISGVIMICLTMSACTYNIYPEDIESGVEICKSNGGVYRFLVTTVWTSVTCNNGLKSGYLGDLRKQSAVTGPSRNADR